MARRKIWLSKDELDELTDNLMKPATDKFEKMIADFKELFKNCDERRIYLKDAYHNLVNKHLQLQLQNEQLLSQKRQLTDRDNKIDKLTKDLYKWRDLMVRSGFLLPDDDENVKITAKSSSEAPILQQGLFGNVTKDSLAEMFLHFSKTADKEELKSLVNVIRETLATRGLQIGEDSDV